jgi:hypothetical protein
MRKSGNGNSMAVMMGHVVGPDTFVYIPGAIERNGVRWAKPENIIIKNPAALNNLLIKFYFTCDIAFN